MKIACLVIPIVLCVMLVILPIFELIALLSGLDFNIYSELVMPIILTVLAVGAVIAIYIMKPDYGRTGKIFCNLLTPLALLNALCFVDCNSFVTVILAIIWSGCVFAIYLKFVPDGFFKAASAVVSVLLTIAFVALYLVVNVLGNVTNTRTIEETLESPDGALYAEISTVDALFGEKMEVVVRDNSPTGALFGSYTYKDQTVYEGEPHETQTARIEWKDDDTLLINGTEYDIVFE